ncbi:hypothetical protein NC651_022858 [Populus alba x Populus x berolinensis]|nr:hypothetical protein NC651_022858 [Populus alba x Populus x berolinensis]
MKRFIYQRKLQREDSFMDQIQGTPGNSEQNRQETLLLKVSLCPLRL